jgi:hypothetical protein
VPPASDDAEGMAANEMTKMFKLPNVAANSWRREIKPPLFQRSSMGLSFYQSLH